MRLIDADAFVERLKEWNTGDSMDKALYNFALHRILESPTIDDIPVIRCKDCHYWKHWNVDDYGYCWQCRDVRHNNHYCSWAEKSDADD